MPFVTFVLILFAQGRQQAVVFVAWSSHWPFCRRLFSSSTLAGARWTLRNQLDGPIGDLCRVVCSLRHRTDSQDCFSLHFAIEEVGTLPPEEERCSRTLRNRYRAYDGRTAEQTYINHVLHLKIFEFKSTRLLLGKSIRIRCSPLQSFNSCSKMI